MSQQTWTYDAPTGVYKNHAMSANMREAAIAETKFMQFVDPEPGYGKNKGESITITRVSNITEPTNARLTETDEIPEDTFSLSTVAITVSEFGRAVPFTSLAKDLGAFNLENKIQMKLKDQLQLVMDRNSAAAFKTAKVCAVPDGVSSVAFSTNGTPSTAGVANLNMYHVEQIRDYMKSTLHIPAYSGDDYICLASTKACRGLKTDPKWEQWKVYTDPAGKFNAEVGRIENIRFIEVNNTNALSGSKGTGSVQGEAVFFGADAVAMAVAADPELRTAIPKDFGRKQSVAWYGILEFGIIWDTANDGEARVVRFTST